MEPVLSAVSVTPSKAWIWGRALCIFAAFIHGILPGMIDIIDPHHLFNPAWPPHARLHLVWLILVGWFLAAYTMSLYWKATPRTFELVRIGATIGGIHIGAFLIACLFKNVVGAGYDADDRVLFGFLPPALLHFSLAAALLFTGYSLCKKASLDPATRAEA